MLMKKIKTQSPSNQTLMFYGQSKSGKSYHLMRLLSMTTLHLLKILQKEEENEFRISLRILHINHEDHISDALSNQNSSKSNKNTAQLRIYDRLRNMQNGKERNRRSRKNIGSSTITWVENAICFPLSSIQDLFTAINLLSIAFYANNNYYIHYLLFAE